jgi:glycosyltransferase involved in cell wall biosynthesis
MASAEPLISAIIPVHDGARYLGEAIESVLAQGRADCELVVVDDGSTDNSAQIARAYAPNVQYLYQPQSGAGAARNTGIARARGRFVALLDADDRWMTGKLTIQLAAFERDPTLDAVFGYIQQGLSPELDWTRVSTKRFAPEVAPGHLPGTMLATREALSRVGPYTTTQTLGDGIDWYLRAVDLQLRMVMLPDVLLWRRIHDANMGIQQRDSRQDYIRIVKSALDRRRSRVGTHESVDSAPQADGPIRSSEE